jgi:ADP-ribose pyrophosphatase YjhB (NUDIX family)
VRHWQVAGAIIPAPAEMGHRGVLLVENVRRNGSRDWTPPGGVVELADGETILEGLAREVQEETGLVVVDWVGPLYRVTTEAPDMGWVMSVEVHLGLRCTDPICVGDDPDGIVVSAEYFHEDECHLRVAEGHPWVRDPLCDWLGERWQDETREYRYRLSGSTPGSSTITRLA